jgi:hypothetical protein
MKLNSFEISAAVLGVGILTVLLLYCNSRSAIVAGLVYLLSAACLTGVCMVRCFQSSIQRSTLTPAERWLLRKRTGILLFAAWQLAILGSLNIWALELTPTWGVLALSYGAAFLFLLVADRQIAAADNADQYAGSQTIRVFGYPCLRRLGFWSLIVYPSAAIAVVGVYLFTQLDTVSIPFRAPEVCLLLCAIYSAGVAIMAIQRYSGTRLDKRHAAWIAAATIFLLIPATIHQALLSYSLYPYLLTCCTLITIAASTCWLLQAKPATADKPSTLRA